MTGASSLHARAFCPGHISTFFVPKREAGGQRRLRGSLGAGFSIDAGVTVRARAEGEGRGGGGRAGLPFDLVVRDNRRPASAAGTTAAMLRLLVARAPRGFRFPRSLTLDNAYALPLGAGFGVSGACALAGALAVNAAMGLGLPRRACVAAAHGAEVEMLTGLGDVPAQAAGGFEVRVRAGPPPAGRILTPPFRTQPVVLASFGPKPTRAFLSTPARSAAAARAGNRALRHLLDGAAGPSLEGSVREGRAFANELGLVSREASALMAALGPEVPCSIAMLGDSVFAFGGRAVERSIRHSARGAFVMPTRVSRLGARLL